MSLGRIHLRDFVIVKELEIEFSKGFTVLTGETGAGKSILIDALQIALGARSETGFVREGASKAEVCVQFTPNATLKEWLIDSGFDDEDEWLIKRVIEPLGKSKAWLNGSPITTGQLKGIGEQLLDIHGQHAWQSLTKADAIRGLLDAYAGVDTTALKACWDQWKSTLTKLKEAQAAPLIHAFHQHLEKGQVSWLDELVPLAIPWPSGGTIKLSYVNESPEAQVKLQECFALTAHPTLCEGRLAVQLQLCTPDGKRLTTTTDWPSFVAREWPKHRQAVAKKFSGVLWR